MGLLNYLRSFTFGSGPKSEVRVLMLGLDNAGKSSILRKLADEDIMTVRPTMGFQIKVLHHGELTLNVWDVGGNYISYTLRYCLFSPIIMYTTII